MLRKYKKKLKSHDIKDLLSRKFSDKCKKDREVLETHGKFLKVNHKNLLDEHGLFPFIPFTSGLLCPKFQGQDGWFNDFIYFESHKFYVNEHCTKNEASFEAPQRSMKIKV